MGLKNNKLEKHIDVIPVFSKKKLKWHFLVKMKMKIGFALFSIRACLKPLWNAVNIWIRIKNNIEREYVADK